MFMPLSQIIRAFLGKRSISGERKKDKKNFDD